MLNKVGIKFTQADASSIQLEKYQEHQKKKREARELVHYKNLKKQEKMQQDLLADETRKRQERHEQVSKRIEDRKLKRLQDLEREKSPDVRERLKAQPLYLKLEQQSKLNEQAQSERERMQLLKVKAQPVSSSEIQEHEKRY